MLENDRDHVIYKKDILIRPGASRRFSFRGTPGGQVSIDLWTGRGPDLGDTERPVDTGPRLLRVAELTKPAPSTIVDAQPRGEALSARAGEPAQLEATLLGAMLRGGGSVPSEDDPNAPILTMDHAGELALVDPAAFVARRGPPLRVRVGVRDGPDLLDQVVAQPSRGFGTARPERPFPGHDIVDVTFTNPNRFPVLLSTFIRVQNELSISRTKVPHLLLGRVFRDTLLFLAPTFGIRDGKLCFAFNEEVQSGLGIEEMCQDLGLDVDVTVKIEPVDVELLSHGEAIHRLALEVEQEIKQTDPRDCPRGDRPLPPVPDDFVARTVETFFSGRQALASLFREMGLRSCQWEQALARRPLLTPRPAWAGARDDAVLCFHLRLTEIIAGASVLELNVDTITATFYLVLLNGNSVEPHPVQSLRDDWVPGGRLVPRFQLAVDLSRIDVEINLGNVLLKPFEFIAEAALRAVANWIKGHLASEAVRQGMAYLDRYRLRVGELATSTMSTIGNRNHVFRRLSTGPDAWIIETLDPAQLAVPFIESDPVDHRFDQIDATVPDVLPIDGPMPFGAGKALRQVNHLVFLMMENRSFDHMLGYLSHPNHGKRVDVDGLDGRAVALGEDFIGTWATPQSEPAFSFAPDPGHGFETCAIQIAGGAMDGFVSEFAHLLDQARDKTINHRSQLNDPERILQFYTADQLPIYDALSKDYAVLDRWFCSIPGPTYPNRVCYYAGLTPVLGNSEVFRDAGYLNELTLFEVLDHEGVEWVVYEGDISFLRMFERYRLETERIRPLDELFNRDRPPALPPVTFIDPNFTGIPSAGPANDDHPTTDVRDGQAFIARVVRALQHLPSWSTTLLVIMYDEHGGFADHVPPPGTPASDFPPLADGSPGVPLAHPDAGCYGPRVPAFAISPLIRPGTVGRHIYDHATVYGTVIERFMPQLRNSPIVPERVRRARHLGELLVGLTIAVPQARAPKRLFTATVSAPPPEPAAVIRTAQDAYRPHLADPPDTEDFHYFMTRIGNPLNERR